MIGTYSSKDLYFKKISENILVQNVVVAKDHCCQLWRLGNDEG
jgi:hypothetical protein